jgi:hypothetical protein
MSDKAGQYKQMGVLISPHLGTPVKWDRLRLVQPCFNVYNIDLAGLQVNQSQSAARKVPRYMWGVNDYVVRTLNCRKNVKTYDIR